MHNLVNHHIKKGKLSLMIVR